MNELPVILRTLLRNRTALLLTAFQVALTLAVLVNVFAATQGFRRVVDQPMGIDEDRLIAVTSEYLSSSVGSDALLGRHRDRIERELVALRGIAGIERVSVTNGFPHSDAVPVRQLKAKRDDDIGIAATFYTGDENYIDALGVTLVEGRGFSRDEVRWSGDPNLVDGAPVVLLSRALAERLFTDGSAVDRSVYIGERMLRVIGVVDRLPGLHPLWSNVELSYVVPGVRTVPTVRYLLRVSDDRLDPTVAAVEAALYQVSPDAVIQLEPLAEVKSRTLSIPMSTITILGGVSVLLLIVTALGCYGQTAFVVTKRTREIGIRRAIGATRAQVTGHFLIENWLMTTVGVLVGILLTFVLNIVLVEGLGANKVDSALIAPCVLFLWVLGLLSALVPALRANRVPPATATRNA